MEQLNKIGSHQLYRLWKNLSIGLLSLIATIAISKILNAYLSPIVSLAMTAALYRVLTLEKERDSATCPLVLYTLFIVLVAYTFVTIILNVIHLMVPFVTAPKEFVFLSDPFIPSLILVPVAFVTVTVIYLRRHSLSICVDCKLRNGDSYERGSTGVLLSRESHFQLRNLIFLFGVLSVVIWVYYLFIYIQVSQNARDWYVFAWLTIIMFLLDEVYFIYRYYNLYLDLRESRKIVTQDELGRMAARTYLRFYVICGNQIYVDPHAVTAESAYREVIDTPFMTKRPMNGIPLGEVKDIIKQMTGVDGELRFFYGRRVPSVKQHTLLRYFYFIDEPADGEPMPKLRTTGEWMDYEQIKRIYATAPGKLATLSVADTTRLATIIITEKMFDSEGRRKNKLKNYKPDFNLHDVRKSVLDFQDDKWIRISLFNSDVFMYGLRKWWRGITGASNRISKSSGPDL